jgi:signal transduction histidine kinase
MVAGIHYLLRYEGGVSEAGKQMLERVNGAGQRLRKLLDELELAVWIDGGPEGALAIEPCRAVPLALGAQTRLTRAATQRRVNVVTALPEDLPEIEGDPELLGVAIELLLDFAIARSPDRRVELSVLGPACVRVADEGGAVDEPTLGRLFEPFVEKDLIPRPEPGARRRERLGLGLSIARGILEAHGGGLVAELTEGGIALTATLARSAQPRPPAAPPAPAQP